MRTGLCLCLVGEKGSVAWERHTGGDDDRRNGVKTLKRGHTHTRGVATDTHDRRSNGRQTTITTAAATAAEAAPDTQTPDTTRHTHCPGWFGADGTSGKSLRPSAKCRHHDALPVTDILVVRPVIRCAVRRVLYGSTRGSADKIRRRSGCPIHSIPGPQFPSHWTHGYWPR